MDTSLLYYFVLFAVFSAAALYKFNKTYVVGISFMLGWLFLPSYVFQLSEMPKQGVFPIWILGSSVPSLDWFSKAWFIPCILLASSLAIDSHRFKTIQYKWPDALMVAWCIWPIAQSLFADKQEPSSWVQAAYLTGAWGAPWLLGRAYFSTAADQFRLIKTITLACLLYVPISIIEGVWGPLLHEYLYAANAFRYIGIERYIGYRPIGFLEDGNQFGVVIGLTSILAIWLARLAVGPNAKFYRFQASLLCAMTLAAQSVGAIGLAITGVLLIFFWHQLNAKLALVSTLFIFTVISLMYVLTADVGNWMWNSSIGQALVGFTKSICRGSFAWRVWADQVALATVRSDIFFGTGNWAWWRQANIRPWGLPQLLVGQFGLVAVLVAFTAICSGAIANIFGSSRKTTRQPKGGGVILSILLVLAMLDALLNSFVYFPLFLIGGALAGKVPSLSELRKFLPQLSS
jgi:hypothetical protein